MTTISTEEAIVLRDVEFRWSQAAAPVLDIAELSIGGGEHAFLLGPSGSGKSTLLNLLAGISRPTRGEVRLLGQPVSQWRGSRRDQFRVDHIGLIFQQFNLLPYLTVLQNTLLPCRFSARRRRRAAADGDAHESAQRLLRGLGLAENLWHRRITALSVGQQQRVAAARALIGQPELIIADEPTSALDADSRDAFIRLLFEHARQSTIVFVSHDRSLAPLFRRTLPMSAFNQAVRP